jgi:hypothetical protein
MLIKPVTTEALNQPASRPLNAGMNCEKALSLLPFELSGFQIGLQIFSDQINKNGE